NNGDVVFNYQGTTFTSGFDFGSSATVGIKNVGTSSPDALQVSLNTATNLVRDHNAIRITTQNLASSPDPLAAANTFGYRAQKRPFQILGNSMDLITGNAGVTTIVGTNQDDTSNTYDLGSNVFRFYNTNYTGNNKIFVSSNGLITFGSSNAAYANGDLSTGVAQAAIAPFWDDLHTGTGNGSVLAKLVDMDGDGVNEFLIIEWSQVRTFDDTDNSHNVTFQTILQLNTGSAAGDFYLNYPDSTFGNGHDTGASATIGIKDATSPGPADTQQLSLNASYSPIADGNALMFLGTKGAPITTTVTVNNVAPSNLVITPSLTNFNEGTTITLSGSFVDPGTLDTHTVTINWNDGSANTVLNLAAGVLTYSTTHLYADDRPS